MSSVLLFIHILVALLLIGVILLQRSEGGGLGMGTSGGAGAFMTARGTANLLTKMTSILAAIFMISSLTMAILAGNHGQGSSILDQLPSSSTAPAPASAPPANNAAPAMPAVPLSQ